MFARRAAARMRGDASIPVELAGSPVLDGHHRVAGDGTLSIDVLCERNGTVALDGGLEFGEAPVIVDSIAREASGAAREGEE